MRICTEKFLQDFTLRIVTRTYSNIYEKYFALRIVTRTYSIFTRHVDSEYRY